MIGPGMINFRPRHRQRDDRGSMAILMMVMIVGLMLSALLVPMIITQDRTTRFTSTRVQALDAAQAGIDVSLGLIRASQTLITGTINYYGDSGKLPCGPLTGVVNSTGIASYSVVVEYFTLDPVAEPPYPLSTKAMKCVAAYGTFDPLSGLSTPKYARFTSTGYVGTATNGSTAGRTVTATYLFRTSNVNVSGGVVQIVGGSVSLCMDVGFPLAPAATQVVLQPCSLSTPPAAQQVFAYRVDLTLQLLSSVSPSNLNGFCLDSPNNPPQQGDPVRLTQCGVLGTPTPSTQQWSYNDNGQFQAALPTTASDGNLAGLCMTAATQAASQPVTLTACGSAAGWTPAASVGAGAAAAAQQGGGAMQWVNFNEFGRCLDVTGQNVNATFLIDYPCKQNPFAGAVRWNQLFQAPVIPVGQSSAPPGRIFTTPTAGQTQYCLASPGIDGNPVVVQPCTGSAPQTWTVYGGDAALAYSSKYTIVNTIAGVSLCLGIPPSTATKDLPPWSSIIVEACSGATDQKWNGDPNLLKATQQNIHER